MSGANCKHFRELLSVPGQKGAPYYICVVLVLKGDGGNCILKGFCKWLLVLFSVVEYLRFTVVVHSESCRC